MNEGPNDRLMDKLIVSISIELVVAWQIFAGSLLSNRMTLRSERGTGDGNSPPCASFVAGLYTVRKEEEKSEPTNDPMNSVLCLMVKYGYGVVRCFVSPINRWWTVELVVWSSVGLAVNVNGTNKQSRPQTASVTTFRSISSGELWRPSGRLKSIIVGSLLDYDDEDDDLSRVGDGIE